MAIGRNTAEVTNVKAFGAKGDGVTNDLPALQAAHDAAGVGPVFLPQGTYKIPDGQWLELKKPMYGAGRTASVITCKNAWGLWSGTGQEIWLHHFSITQRTGSTSGGCLMVGNLPGGPAGAGGPYSYHTGWYIRDLYFVGVSTSPDPMVWMDGLVGGWMEHCQFAGDAPKGLLITAYFYSNIVGIYNNSFANNSTVAANRYGYGSELFGNDYFLYGNDWENPGRGLVLCTSGSTVMNNWFENVDETNLDLMGSNNWIVNNRFHQHKKVMTNTTHIRVRGSSGGAGYMEITNAVWNGDGTITFTTDQPHNLFNGAQVDVARVVPVGYNGLGFSVASMPTTTSFRTSNTVSNPGAFSSAGVWGWTYSGGGRHLIEKNKFVDPASVTVDVGPGTSASWDDKDVRWEDITKNDGGLTLEAKTPWWMRTNGSRYAGLFAGDHGVFTVYGDPHQGGSEKNQEIFRVAPAGQYADWPSAGNMPNSVLAVIRNGYVVFRDEVSSGTPPDDGGYLGQKSWFFYWDTATERIGIKWRGSGFNNSLIPLPAVAQTWTANQTFPAVKVQSGQGANAGIHFRNAADVSIFSGGGDPEGVYTASPGSLYLDEGGAAYIKVTGTGNTGWKAITHA